MKRGRADFFAVVEFYPLILLIFRDCGRLISSSKIETTY